MGDLLDALGRPPLEALLPGARDPRWGPVRKSIEAALRLAGTGARVRTPSALWALARAGTRPPRGATWADLVTGVLLTTLVDNVRVQSRDADVVISSWNARWLVSPHSDQAAAKRAVMHSRLARGEVVCLQETHWGGRPTRLCGAASFPMPWSPTRWRAQGPQVAPKAAWPLSSRRFGTSRPRRCWSGGFASRSS